MGEAGGCEGWVWAILALDLCVFLTELEDAVTKPSWLISLIISEGLSRGGKERRHHTYILTMVPACTLYETDQTSRVPVKLSVTFPSLVGLTPLISSSSLHF